MLLYIDNIIIIDNIYNILYVCNDLRTFGRRTWTDSLMPKDDLAKRSVWSFTSVFTTIIPLVIL